LKQVAILGPTASGKTSLSIELAKKVDANILSLDSLSVYKEVDIVSAKPTIQEREGIKHFGVDELYIDEYFSVAIFFDIYKKAKQESENEDKNLIIVGGTSFYLKSMIDGLSNKIELSQKNRKDLDTILLDLYEAYKKIEKIDPIYATKISSNDSFRIEKWYEIYLETTQSASEYFSQNEQKPLINKIKIFDINIDRAILRDRIERRTNKMIKDGLIDEVFKLETKYGRVPKPMGAIGIKETLDYLDGKVDKQTLSDLIMIHTAQLAKRQETFNRSQFPDREILINNNLNKKILSNF
jgi:tRNA dimethylallyltransferase